MATPAAGTGAAAVATERTVRSPRIRGRALLGLVCRLGLAAVWLVSGWSKERAPLQTQVAVRAYRIFPTSVADLIASVLPLLELALGVLLLVGLATRFVAALSAVLLLVFIAGVISAAARGLSIDCGCFGGGGNVPAGATSYTLEILRDCGFLLLAGYLLWRPQTPASIDGFARDRAAARAW